MKIVLLLISLLAMQSVMAASYTVTCDPPTERTDGTPLSISEIDHYNWFVDGVLDGISTGCSYEVIRPGGLYSITASTTDTDGLSDGQSPPFLLTLQNAPPRPPGNLQ